MTLARAIVEQIVNISRADYQLAPENALALAEDWLRQRAALEEADRQFIGHANDGPPEAEQIEYLRAALKVATDALEKIGCLDKIACANHPSKMAQTWGLPYELCARCAALAAIRQEPQP